MSLGIAWVRVSGGFQRTQAIDSAMGLYSAAMMSDWVTMPIHHMDIEQALIRQMMDQVRDGSVDVRNVDIDCGAARAPRRRDGTA